MVASDSTSPASAGTGLVDPTATAATAGGSGIALDQTDGLQISSGGKTYNVDLSSAKTIQDVLTAINNSGSGLDATINPQGTGINVVSKLKGGGQFFDRREWRRHGHATGLANFHRVVTQLADLNLGNRGSHQRQSSGTDFTIQRFRTEAPFRSVSSGPPAAQTVGDVLNLINNNPQNTAGARPGHRHVTIDDRQWNRTGHWRYDRHHAFSGASRQRQPGGARFGARAGWRHH